MPTSMYSKVSIRIIQLTQLSTVTTITSLWSGSSPTLSAQGLQSPVLDTELLNANKYPLETMQLLPVLEWRQGSSRA